MTPICPETACVVFVRTSHERRDLLWPKFEGRKARSLYARFEFRPPVRQGDLYVAAREGPRAIGVIDGYFDGVPAVWHKEILWALANGIAVFGAASMGALRAAELHSFGMQGVGRIFEDYRDNRITDDDEVALLHGPAETGYVALTEPMVNIRATLERAVAEGVIAKEVANVITETAKARFYQERTWETVMAAAAPQLPREIVERLTAWLPAGHVDQKRADALLLLSAIDRFMEQGAKPSPTRFTFEFTECWANAPWRNEAINNEKADSAILDELRLKGDDYFRLRRNALLQLLVREEAAKSDSRPDRREIASMDKEIRLRLGLLRRKSLSDWLSENDLSEARFEGLVADLARLETFERSQDADLQSYMLDQLRIDNSYRTLRKRAREKANLSATMARDVRARVPPPVLVSWYFSTRLKKEVPEDIADYAARLGLTGLDHFYDLLALEYALALDDGGSGHGGALRKNRLS